MIVHRIMADDGDEEVYFARTGPNLYILEIHTKRAGKISVTFTELDDAGARELLGAIGTELGKASSI